MNTSRNATAASAFGYFPPLSLALSFPKSPKFLFSTNNTPHQNGTILTYPSSSQVSIHATTPTTPYIFGRAIQSHEFCPVCGVSIYIRKLSVTPEHFAKYGKKDQKAWEQVLPVNLRCFEEVEWDGIVVKKGGLKDAEPKYEV